MNILIVGTGPSIALRTVTLKADIIIAVNQASLIPDIKPDLWFTLDLSERNLELIDEYTNIHSKCKFIVACELRTKLPRHVYRVQRISNKYEHATSSFERWSCVPTLSEDCSKVHTGNSMWGALQIAYHLKPQKIAMLGLDGSRLPSVMSGHNPRDLSHLPKLFESSVEQLNRNNIQVVNGSPNSSVTCFNRMSPDEAITWVNQYK